MLDGRVLRTRRQKTIRARSVSEGMPLADAAGSEENSFFAGSKQATQAGQVVLAQQATVGGSPGESTVPGTACPHLRFRHQRLGYFQYPQPPGRTRRSRHLLTRLPDEQRQLLCVASQHFQMIAASTFHGGRPVRQGLIELVQFVVELIEKPEDVSPHLRAGGVFETSNPCLPRIEAPRRGRADKASAILCLQ